MQFLDAMIQSNWNFGYGAVVPPFPMYTRNAKDAIAVLMLLVQYLYFTTHYFKTTLDYKTAWFGPKGQFSVLNDLYFKTTCNIRPHFLVPWVVLK